MSSGDIFHNSIMAFLRDARKEDEDAEIDVLGQER